jgi:glutamate dehydrogenase/leucine dehydrogenase
VSTSVASRVAYASVSPLTGHEKHVISTLRETMTRAFRQIVETSVREGVTLRDAAYMIGIGWVAEASRLRGWV